jgi:lysophospholipase L1-like esterase
MASLDWLAVGAVAAGADGGGGGCGCGADAGALLHAPSAMTAITQVRTARSLARRPPVLPGSPNGRGGSRDHAEFSPPRAGMDRAPAPVVMLRLLAAALLAATGCATAALSEDQAPSYLALGDSVAFGFDPRVDLTTQEVRGYPELLAERRGLELMNLACPGEASGGFVDPRGIDNHCRENRQQYPLHVDYAGTQLHAAIELLQATPSVELVTIDLGANDVFLLDHLCGRDLSCILANFVTTLHDYDKNLDFIFTQLRKVYDGPLVALTIYNPYPGDSTAQYAIEKINEALARHVEQRGGVVADGMAAFAGDPCTGGLLIGMPDGSCDVHPSEQGAAKLADAIEARLGDAVQ